MRRFRRVGVGVGAKGPFATKWLNRIAQGLSPGFVTIMDAPERAPETRIVFIDPFRAKPEFAA